MMLLITTAALQETQALPQRLQQPTAATVAAEYDKIVIMTAWTAPMISPQPSGRIPAISLPQDQLNALMQRWCSLAEPLLLLLTDEKPLPQRGSDAADGVGLLLMVMANLLEFWVRPKAERQAVKQQIAQHTAGGRFA
jgi:hypothetical protein